jgi:hypothetical protein
MSKFNKKDMELLSEAYTLRLLKEQAPSMTLEQVQRQLQYMTESEAEYVITVCERITEAFGGLGNIGKAIGGAVKGLGNGLKGVGRGAIEAGKEFGGNVKDIYQSGQDVKKFQGVVNKAQAAMQQLIDLVTQAKNSGVIAPKGDIIDMTLGDIIYELDDALGSHKNFEKQALDKGLGGGVGSAFMKGFKNKPAPRASSGPPPLPTP